ncbi:hypothetical protein LWI29_003936 [Acer saccharum]|uniref:DUF7734 domain-containing protein n=1 Tax=Acer saccharum TaxID=4024 RepID=A0AA39RFI4_ACESA|nr:hypothetical protein LWI29_003936 [Acer saccharum]
MLKQLGGRCHLLHVFSNSNTTSLCTTTTVTHVKFAIDDKSLKKLSSSHRRVLGTRCGARRRVRYDRDDDEDGEEDQYYGHNEEIAMLELYTQSAREEALLVTALLDDNEVEVLIFKGFSSSLSHRTSADPSRSVLPSRAVIKCIDRIRGPFDPSNIQYIEKNIQWNAFKTTRLPPTS